MSSQNGNAAWVNIETLERRGARPGTADRRGGGRRRQSLELGHADRRFAPQPTIWYMASQFLYESTDKGSSWRRISGDCR